MKLMTKYIPSLKRFILKNNKRAETILLKKGKQNDWNEGGQPSETSDRVNTVNIVNTNHK